MIRRLRYFVRHAATSIRRAPLPQLVSVTTIAASILLLGVFLTVQQSVAQLTSDWAAHGRLIAFLTDDAPPETARAIERTVLAWPEVEAVTVRDRDAALADFKQALGADADLVDGLSADALPASVEVSLRSTHRAASDIAALTARLRALPALGHVDEISAGEALLSRLRRVGQLLRGAAGFLALLVAVAVIFITSNTVRLTLYTRREAVEVMRQVGATDRFIQTPYYLEGVFQGASGAALALALLSIFRGTMDPESALSALGLPTLTLGPLPASTMAGLVLGAGAVGALASHLATSRFLRDASTGHR